MLGCHFVPLFANPCSDLPLAFLPPHIRSLFVELLAELRGIISSPYLCTGFSHCLKCSSLPSSVTKHSFIVQVKVRCSEIPSLSTHPASTLVMLSLHLATLSCHFPHKKDRLHGGGSCAYFISALLAPGPGHDTKEELNSMDD